MFTDWLLVGNRVFAGRAMSTSSVRRTRNINSDKVLDRWWIFDYVLGRNLTAQYESNSCIYCCRFMWLGLSQLGLAGQSQCWIPCARA